MFRTRLLGKKSSPSFLLFRPLSTHTHKIGAWVSYLAPSPPNNTLNVFVGKREREREGENGKMEEEEKEESEKRKTLSLFYPLFVYPTRNKQR